MAGNFNLQNYAEVKDRIAQFVADFPNGAIQTKILKDDGPEVIIEARIFRTVEEAIAGVYTSGIAREVEGKSPVNKTSHIENCETSAIGRALANMAYGADAQRASRSEMIKVERMNRELTEMLDYIKESYPSIADDVMAKIGGQDVKLKEFIKANGKKLPEQFRLAREVVDAIEVALKPSVSTEEAAD